MSEFNICFHLCSCNSKMFGDAPRVLTCMPKGLHPSPFLVIKSTFKWKEAQVSCALPMSFDCNNKGSTSLGRFSVLATCSNRTVFMPILVTKSGYETNAFGYVRLSPSSFKWSVWLLFSSYILRSWNSSCFSLSRALWASFLWAPAAGGQQKVFLQKKKLGQG